MKLPALESILSGSSETTKLRTLLFDGVTGLPTLPLVLESFRDMAAEQSRLGFIFVDTSPFAVLEQDFGWEVTDNLLTETRVFLDSILSSFAPFRIFSMHRVTGDNFILVVSSESAHDVLTEWHLGKISEQVERDLNDHLALRLTAELAPFARIFNGCAMLHYNSGCRFERLLAQTVNRAFRESLKGQQEARQKQVKELKEILDLKRIRILFQPIFDLQNRKELLGYEALSRGPEGSVFESADFMFSLAGDCGLLNPLENLCQASMLSVLQKQTPGPLIFINLEPSFLELDGYQNLVLFKNAEVNPQNVVLEITERLAIKDYSAVTRTLEDIRKLGFRIAVDDVGSGYASLESIAYLKPDFIKINEKMINGISSDFIKQEIVKTLRDLAGRLSVSVIAEGIEDPRDLETLQNLQVPFGQGYLLQRPSEGLFG